MPVFYLCPCFISILSSLSFTFYAFPELFFQVSQFFTCPIVSLVNPLNVKFSAILEGLLYNETQVCSIFLNSMQIRYGGFSM